MADDEGEGVGLPQKGLNLIIKDSLPDMRIANETRELLNACCVEFIKHVSREAQLISSKDQRKTIYHDHVQKALKNLGFPREYVDSANSVLGECKIAAEKRLKRKNSRLDKCGIPEEQLWQMQQRLIEQARRSEAEKQQSAGQFGSEFHQQTQLAGPEWQCQSAAAELHATQSQFIKPPLPPPIAFSSMEPGDSSSSLPSMMMPFGLNPQQLIVPSTSINPQFGGPPTMDPNMATAAQLLFQSTVGMSGGGQKRGEEEEEEEDYDV